MQLNLDGQTWKVIIDGVQYIVHLETKQGGN